jgi:phosphonate transport system permease protein
MLGKVYAEILESGDTHATQTLLRNGSSRLQAFLYGLLPQNAAELTSYTVYRWECAIRSSVVLGFVGAGGLGQQLDNSMKMFHGGEVLTMLAVFVALVALADAVSASLRRAPTRAGPGHRWNAGAIAAAGALLLAAVSFATLGLQWAQFFSLEALRSMGRFVAEFFPPDLATAFLLKVWMGTWETLAMSALGTLLAALAGLALALPASRLHEADAARGRGATRLLGPFAGTLALAAHTTGVLGRLFAEAIENAPSGPGDALRAQGVGNLRVFLYATLPQVLPQLMSYTLYRWENNIRAAAVLGVVGAGGLGQLLAFHMGLFHMGKTATILGAMLLLVALVDLASLLARRALTR